MSKRYAADCLHKMFTDTEWSGSTDSYLGEVNDTVPTQLQRAKTNRVKDLELILLITVFSPLRRYLVIKNLEILSKYIAVQFFTYLFNEMFISVVNPIAVTPLVLMSSFHCC